MAEPKQSGLVVRLGAAQTLAWASTYYLPAILAAPMARDIGVSTATVFAAFSVGLVISAVLGPRAGRSIDAQGGRAVLSLSSLVFAAGLLGLGLSTETWHLFAAWAVIGIGMSGGLYESAFAALVKLYGSESRNPITGVTLLAGFASTVGWPLSTLLEGWLGWQGTCFAWAALHLLLGLPLNLSIPKDATRHAASTKVSPAGDQAPKPVPMRSSVLLALVFALTWFISTAMAAHLPALMSASGVGVSVALLAGALVGPGQVAGRLLDFGFMQRIHPLRSARLASVMHPAGAVLLVVWGAPAAIVFALMHGLGNGILTIAKGTLPLALFGPQGYGERQGLLMVPARLAQALAPWLFGLCVEQLGAGALWVSAALGALVLWALMLLSHTSSTPPGIAAK